MLLAVLFEGHSGGRGGNVGNRGGFSNRTTSQMSMGKPIELAFKLLGPAETLKSKIVCLS